MKVAYNSDFDGYDLSNSVLSYLVEKQVISHEDMTRNRYACRKHIPRHNKFLIEALELFKEDNPGIKIIDIPGNCYYISNYDGAEDVIYPGHSKWIVASDGEL